MNRWYSLFVESNLMHLFLYFDIFFLFTLYVQSHLSRLKKKKEMLKTKRSLACLHQCQQIILVIGPKFQRKKLEHIPVQLMLMLLPEKALKIQRAWPMIQMFLLKLISKLARLSRKFRKESGSHWLGKWVILAVESPSLTCRAKNLYSCTCEYMVIYAFVCFLSQISKTEFDSASQRSVIQKEVFVLKFHSNSFFVLS